MSAKPIQLPALLGTAVLSAIANPCIAGPRFCDDATARMVARAYVLSIPLLDQHQVLDQLIVSNRALFSTGGAAVTCMKRTGAALMSASIKAYRPERPGSSAQERWGSSMPPELAHLPKQVDESMGGGGAALDLFNMGNELMWLSRVLPAALQGRPELYNAHDTSWRRTMIQMIPMVNLLCAMDGDVCGFYREMTKSLVPAIENQVYVLATGRY